MTTHSLLRLSERLVGVPHLITEAGLAPILDYLQLRNSPAWRPELASGAVPDAREARTPTKIGTVGEIHIDGALTYRPIIGACGEGPLGVSYSSILEDAEELMEGGVKTLVLTCSSPGGEAQHCFSTAEDLRAMADDYGVELVTYIDTMSASACLAIGVVSDKVFIHPSATTGSIGCVVAILDKSQAMARAGLKPIYISSTPGKTPFAEDGGFSPEFLAELQEDVTRLGNQFAAHVEKYTGIDVETIKAMDARMYHAEAALEAGLVNEIMDHKQFAEFLTGK